MTNYKIDGDKIIITDGIDIKAALFSGQVFRVKTLSENKYFLVSTSHAAIVEDGETITITCDDVEYFVNYFDLNSDYSKILDEVTDEYALSAIGFSPKLKILRQDKFETVIDFIMSANNNIKRFSKTLELIAENYGEKLQFKGIEYSAFPTPTQLTKATIEELKALGTGYRDKYIFETARQIDAGFDLQSVCARHNGGEQKALRAYGRWRKGRRLHFAFRFSKIRRVSSRYVDRKAISRELWWRKRQSQGNSEVFYR
ncbi:MAG: hypothetical protein RRZ69_05715 [Clostridia bacterium]